MAIDILVFLAILLPASWVVYKFLKFGVKIFYWSVAVFIAYMLLRFLIL